MLPGDGPGDLADINVPARIYGDSVRCDELAGAFSAANISEAREQFSFACQNTQAGSDIRHLLVDRQAGSEFAEVAEGIRSSIHV